MASPVSPGAGVSLPGSFTRERLPPAPLLERSGSAPLSGWVAVGVASSMSAVWLLTSALSHMILVHSLRSSSVLWLVQKTSE